MVILEGGGGGCFPSNSKVTLQDGKSVRMSELQLGDKVQTGTASRQNPC